MSDIILTLVVAGVVGIVLWKLKVPGGMMVGAILGTAIFNITLGRAHMPSEAKFIAQCLAGAFIGCSMGRDDVKEMKNLVKPAAILLGAVFTLNMILGTVIYMCSSMDILTSLLCAVPGGMSDVPIIASDMGADATKVALLQFVRMFTGITIFPSFIIAMTRNEAAASGQSQGGAVHTASAPAGADQARTAAAGTDHANAKTAAAGTDQANAKSADASEKKGHPQYAFPMTLAIALICGRIGKKLGIPAGTLVFSMIGVMIVNIRFGAAFLPKWAKRVAQVLSGAYIGCSVGASDIAALQYMVVPALLILLGYSVNCFIVGHILHSRCGFPLRLGFLIATPAGASDMALLSADLGVESKELVELQIIRMVVVVSVFPQVISLIAKTFG